MLVPLAVQLVDLFRAAAAGANDLVGVEDLLRAILARAPFGEDLRATLRPLAEWRPAAFHAPRGDLGFWTGDAFAYFDQEAISVVLAGAGLVLLGPYQPRHLAEALGRAAELRPERFTRFGFSSRAWLRALATKSADR